MAKPLAVNALIALALFAPAVAGAAPVELAGETLGKQLSGQVEKKPKAKRPRAIAVIAFEEQGALAKGHGASAADAVARGLLEAGQNCVARPALEAALAEKKLAALGAVADDKLGDVQKLASAQAILVGKVSEKDGALRISARIVNAEKGDVLAADEVSADAPAELPLAGLAPPAPEATPEAAAAEVTEVVSGATVEVAMRRLADRLAGSIKKSLPEEARYSRVAVATFAESAGTVQDKQLGTLVPSELSTYLFRDHGLLLVERAQLKALMSELKLSEFGLVEEKDAPELGKLAGAQAMVIGQISEAGDRFLVNARVVDTETGRIIAAEQGAVPAAGLVALSSDAVVLRSTTDAVYRSVLLPGWGQFYNREPVKGVVFASAEVLALGGALTFHLLGASAEDEYKSATPESLGASAADASSQIVELRETAESRYQIRNVMLYTAAGIWAYNVLDAWMNGVDGESQVNRGVALAGSDRGVGLVLELP